MRNAAQAQSPETIDPETGRVHAWRCSVPAGDGLGG
jgi:hypothetical protein